MLGLRNKKEPSIRDVLAKGAVVVDVRSPHEFAAGHYKNSRNIPLDTLGERTDEIGSLYAPVIFVCESGVRSEQARALVQSLGVETHNGGSWKTL